MRNDVKNTVFIIRLGYKPHVKSDIYNQIEKSILSVIEPNNAPISNLANFCAILMETFNHHWIGFYLVNDQNNILELGPFQGPLACTQIQFGKGVCGSSWRDKKTYVVDDVHKFDGHIACSSLSNSEIVVPIIKDDQVVAVLDIDSVEFGKFDQVDQTYLEKFCEHLSLTSF